MYILAIETSTQMCAVALTEDEHLIAESRVNIQNIHAEKLFPLIHSVLAAASFEQQKLDGIAVSIGPGSFAGLRIGLSAAKGIALGHDIPIVSAPTLQALASNAPVKDGHICPVLPSRAHEFYSAVYVRDNFTDSLVQNIEIFTGDEFAASLPDGACIIGQTTLLQQNKKLRERCFFAPESANHASALAVARIGSRKLHAGNIEQIEMLEPHYRQQFIAGKPKKHFSNNE